MSTTVNNPPPTTTPAYESKPTQVRALAHPPSSILQRSNTAADSERFASVLSSLKQKSEPELSKSHTGAQGHLTDEQSRSDSGSPSSTKSTSQRDPSDELDDQSEHENTDGSPFLLASTALPVSLATGMAAGGGLFVSLAGGEASLQGALSASNVATLLENLQARTAAAAGGAMTFRLLDAGLGLTSMQLAQRTNGAWQIQLSAERSSRDNLKRVLEDLESGLIERGHLVDRIVLLDESTKNR